MQITCPHCGNVYEIDREAIGHTVRCEACGLEFRAANPNLAPCPDSFALISKRAAVCPQCGAPLQGAPAGGNVPVANNTPEEEIFVGHPAAIYFLLELVVGFFLSFILIGIPILICTIINIYCTHYTVTTKRVIVKTGWLNKKQVEIWIKDMRGVSLHQDLWQRIIGTGSVAIGTAATAGTEIQMQGLKNAQQVVDKINNLRVS
ncbi:MAG: zinc-ribbon domain-containing protein [Victivallales bacterium]|nr:zinc-ribbon domain-containing protein [Victivallales bacterium]